MNINVRVTTSQKGSAEKWLADFEKRMKGPRSVKVGFPAGKTGRHPGGLVDIVQIAIWNHFGTKGSGKGFSKKGLGGKTFGGFGGPIPPRPFITVAVFRHRTEIRRLLKKIYLDILHGKTTAEIGLSKLGQYGVNIIQDAIKGGGFAPNSPLTIAIKGSSNPLIDSGNMAQAVTYALEAVAGGKVGHTRLYGSGASAPKWKAKR